MNCIIEPESPSSEKVIQQTTDPIECPPGGGDPVTEPDAAAVGADTVNKAAATAPKKIFVCSPYRPASKAEECRKDELMANINCAKTACRILTTLGFLPMAPHLYFTQFLKDDDAQERNTGMKLGMHWLEEADELWVFGNTISEGMATEIEKAHELNKPVRNLPEPGRVVELLLKSISEQYHSKASGESGRFYEGEFRVCFTASGHIEEVAKSRGIDCYRVKMSVARGRSFFSGRGN